jgi:glutamate synthase (NADPH/NADH) large chain
MKHNARQSRPRAAGHRALPKAQGLYDPANEKDACGIGFIAHIKGRRSHDIVQDALTMLNRMDHRGARGAEANTGDGAGVLTALPHDLLKQSLQDQCAIDLPEPGQYGVGMFFLPHDQQHRDRCKQIVKHYVDRKGQRLLGWRKVPTDADGADIGPTARATEPIVEQAFIAAADGIDPDAFERQLYAIRKQAYHKIKADAALGEGYYVSSLSSKIVVYKGQLTSHQVPLYYADLRDERYVSHLAMVHSRFSTNTFPSWDRAQPMRWMSHNGEINTLRGNVNWMRARQGLMQSDLFGDDLKRLMPVIDPITSDSGMFDNVLEFLMLAGRSLPEAAMMMIPEAWENHEAIAPSKRAFYEYHANLMEPWDGPASIAFTDGKYIGATLDRNGLRPSRYYVTDDDRVIMASEVGVVKVDSKRIKLKGRLQPGKMFLVDFDKGRIIADDQLKESICQARPYKKWLAQQRMDLADLPGAADEAPRIESDKLLPLLQAFGYTVEHVNMIMLPMVKTQKEAMGSMGNDAALAVLSDEPRLLYDYFKQLFAQVTNPPIDSIREEIIMSLQTAIGPEGNMLNTTQEQCHRLYLPHPVLDNQQLAAIKQMDHRGWRAKTIDITYPNLDKQGENSANIIAAMERICATALEAIEEGFPLIVLSDRAAGADRIPISSLLAVGAVHHHLIRNRSRTRVGLVVESGEAREVHHFCLLAGYGADAVNPYLALETLWYMRDKDIFDESITQEMCVEYYIKALGKGILKVMSKMGISTLASYKGAQIFEAIGLNEDVIRRCFDGTASRLQGVGFDVLATETSRRHAIGFPKNSAKAQPTLPNPGQYHWRSGGERHTFNPQSIVHLQMAARQNSRESYEQFSQICNHDARQRCTLRGLMKIKTDAGAVIDIEQVEPAANIVKRFRTGAMSFGSLSAEAHETLAVAMNRIGAMSNSGEGGEDPVRFTPMPNGDSKRSAIKQIASGRFGVTSFYLANADALQIKIAQGAKPGEGGQLPGFKVDQQIARVRHSTPGVGLISPPPHHDIYSIEDLAQLIFDLKNANENARISVKLVSEVGVGTVAAGVAKAHADHILISGHDGGTGASPLTSIKHAGLPWELGLAETHQTLVLNDLRSRVHLETDGGLKTGRDVFIAACLGAEEFGFATVPLIAIGCIMMRKCHLNTCPVGVCTQDPQLRKKFNGQPEHVINYMFLLAEEMRQYMAQVGVRCVDDLIGRVDLLQSDDAISHWKSDGLDLSAILTPAQKPRADVAVRKVISQDHGIATVLDRKLIVMAAPALEQRQPVQLDLPIENTDRTVGAMLSYRVSQIYGGRGLAPDTIAVKFKGSAGQSFGAFLAGGITMELEGDANDYVGKGLSGGKLVIYPPKDSSFNASENVIIGNVALYGATAGEAYFRGTAAERFAIRNSGVLAVIEGVGDHACEYMTGGRVVILGKTGRNFAAGMSGGIAYVWDQQNVFLQHCNLGMVELEKMDQPEDIAELHELITAHQAGTGSTVGRQILDDWQNTVQQFVKVMPIDYRRAIEERKKAAMEKDMPEVGHG